MLRLCAELGQRDVHKSSAVAQQLPLQEAVWGRHAVQAQTTQATHYVVQRTYMRILR